MNQQERDTAFQRYVSGLDSGDFTRMAVVLKLAETDDALLQMINRYHEALSADMPPLSDEERAKLRQRIDAIIDSSAKTAANEHEQADRPIS